MELPVTIVALGSSVFAGLQKFPQDIVVACLYYFLQLLERFRELLFVQCHLLLKVGLRAMYEPALEALVFSFLHIFLLPTFLRVSRLGYTIARSPIIKNKC